MRRGGQTWPRLSLMCLIRSTTHPELCFEEIFAHDLITTVIADHGLAVERGAYGLDTAFEAKAGG